MEQEVFRTDGLCAQLYRCNTAIVGSGAAGYNAADCLWRAGQHDILLLTENRLCGTSRNTGSDKQTYYKLTLSGGDGDSVREMAQTLFDGQCVDGDTALCEAALSAPCFLRLAELGVEFPRSRYGEYVGYKTDHDPRRRATSAGPYTSKRMTQMLEAAVCAEGVPMLDGMQVIRILTDGERVLGLFVPEPRSAFGTNTLCADPLPERHLGNRRACRNLRGQRLSGRTPWFDRHCAGGWRNRPKSDRMAVWPRLAAPALERVGHIYAGASAHDLHNARSNGRA